MLEEFNNHRFSKFHKENDNMNSQVRLSLSSTDSKNPLTGSYRNDLAVKKLFH